MRISGRQWSSDNWQMLNAYGGWIERPKFQEYYNWYFNKFAKTKENIACRCDNCDANLKGRQVERWKWKWNSEKREK